MKKAKLIISILILSTLFLLNASAFYQNEEQPETLEQITEEIPVEELPVEALQTEVMPEVVTEVVPVEEIPIPEIPAETESWLNIMPDQVVILQSIFDKMTDYGKAASGWFMDGNYEPCLWNGIACENGMVTAISLHDAGFFCAFPEEIMQLAELKEIHMINLGLRSILPEELLSMPKLEVVELSGNYISGPLPVIPAELGTQSQLKTLIISDNLDTDSKTQAFQAEPYSNLGFCPAEQLLDPNIDLDPGLDGDIPASLSAAPYLSTLDLSGNALQGQIPDALSSLPIYTFDLSSNNQLSISQFLYETLSTREGITLNLEGVTLPVVEPSETPVPSETPIPVIPTDTPVPVIPVIPTDTPVPVIPVIPSDTPVPEIPESAPVIPIVENTTAPEVIPVISEITQVIPVIPAQPTAIVIVVTATSVPTIPYWYTSTPVPQVAVVPQIPQVPQIPPQQPAQPGTVPQIPPVYLSPTPATYQQSNNWQPIPVISSSTPIPTSDPAAFFNFTYVPDQITAENIPMTWSYTGMNEYMINYLDASKNLYPGFAMEWSSAAFVCNASICSANVSNIPVELLQGGNFSIQLQAKDANGRVYQSAPVEMSVSGVVSTEEPTTEKPTSFLGGFFRWLFGPILRLFGG